MHNTTDLTDLSIQDLSARFGVNVEFSNEDEFPVFFQSVRNKRVALVSDKNTVVFVPALQQKLAAKGIDCTHVLIDEYEPVADEKTVGFVQNGTRGCDYLLGVGAGTVNDLCKYAGFLDGKPSGIYATAPSMDGFSSGVTPLIENGFKITRNAQVASDVLVNFNTLKTAPAIMTGAGVGDILAKYCSLADWQLSVALKGEAFNPAAASLMQKALYGCASRIDGILKGDENGLGALMSALLTSGYAMVVAGNSRPASGAEHHVSHYLEMDFLRRNERIPLHGVKVGIGTTLSLYLYRAASRFDFKGADTVRAIADTLPSVESVRAVLTAFGCPTRFSELGIPRETVKSLLFHAHEIRDRFTILALYNEQGLMPAICDELIGFFY